MVLVNYACLMVKMFQTSSVDIVKEYQTMFHFRRVSELILERNEIFAKILLV